LALEHLVTYREWFESKAAERGETVSGEEVRARLEKRERA